MCLRRRSGVLILPQTSTVCVQPTWPQTLHLDAWGWRLHPDGVATVSTVIPNNRNFIRSNSHHYGDQIPWWLMLWLWLWPKKMLRLNFRSINYFPLSVNWCFRGNSRSFIKDWNCKHNLINRTILMVFNEEEISEQAEILMYRSFYFWAQTNVFHLESKTSEIYINVEERMIHCLRDSLHNWFRGSNH